MKDYQLYMLMASILFCFDHYLLSALLFVFALGLSVSEFVFWMRRRLNNDD